MDRSADLVGVVGAYLDHIGVERGLSPHTLAAYRRDLDRFLAFCGRRGISSLAEVTDADVAAFGADLVRPVPEGEGLGPASAARCLSAVRGLHRFAALEGAIARDPAKGVPLPRPPRRLPKALSRADVGRILDAAAAREGALAARDTALLELLYATGARISEAVALDVDDLDTETHAVRLLGKGGKERVVPVGSAARAAVEAYLVRGRPALAAKGRGTSALILNSRGGRLSRQSAWTVLQAAARNAGVEAAVSPHTLRHSFATHLIEGGADVRVVQELLGHASVTTTQMYTLVTIDSLREIYLEAHPRARA